MTDEPTKATFSPSRSAHETSTEVRRVAHFEASGGSTADKLRSFARFVSRQQFAKQFALYELFKMTEGVSGSIVECGVYHGAGLMAYAHMAAAFEPYNYQCRIIGFDTFEGDVGVSDRDDNPYFARKEGWYEAKVYSDLLESIEIYDLDRPVNHIPKVMLVKGDLRDTARRFLEAHPETVIRLLNLTVNLYEPTKAAIEAFLPRVPRGGVVALHGFNYASVGAQRAVQEHLGTYAAARFRNFDFAPSVHYFVVEA